MQVLSFLKGKEQSKSIHKPTHLLPTNSFALPSCSELSSSSIFTLLHSQFNFFFSGRNYIVYGVNELDMESLGCI